MAASYPNLLAAGVTVLDSFEQFDLYAGESDIVTSQGQAADGQAIQQFQVLTRDADGRLVPYATGDEYATGTITVGGQPANNETVTINSVALTFKTTLTGAAHEVLIGADTTETATNLTAAINDDVDTFNVGASSSGTAVTLVAQEVGTAGNSITLAEAVADAGFTVSGATLAGGNATADIPSGLAIGIAVQPVAAATPGAWLPYFTGGVFNHEALVWPGGLNSLSERQRVFDGTNIGVRQLL